MYVYVSWKKEAQAQKVDHTTKFSSSENVYTTYVTVHIYHTHELPMYRCIFDPVK